MNGIERRPRTRRDGRRYDVWRVRWIDEKGRKRSATFDRERDARDFKAKLRILRRSGELASLDAGKETLAEFAAKWWELEAIPNFERSTLKSYSSHWNYHVLPRIGHFELRKLSPQVIVEFPGRARARGYWPRGDPPHPDDASGNAVASGRVGADPNEPCQSRPQAA
jgi:hypothetical protein